MSFWSKSLAAMLAVVAACAPDRPLAPERAVSPLAPRAASRSVLPYPAQSAAGGPAQPVLAIAVDGFTIPNPNGPPLSQNTVEACVVRADGMLACEGHAMPSLAQPRVALAGKFITLTAGGSATGSTPAYVCAARTDGAAECFRSRADAATLAAAPDLVTPSGGRFVQLSAGVRGEGDGVPFTCGLRDDGRVECWGNNALGQAPALVEAIGSYYVHLSAGMTYGCAVRADGLIDCWGGLAPNAPAQIVPGNGARFTQVSASRDYVCGERDDEWVQCVGSVPATAAPLLSSTPGFAEVAISGPSRTCLRRTDGVVSCRGFGTGQNQAAFAARPFQSMTSAYGALCALGTALGGPTPSGEVTHVCIGTNAQPPGGGIFDTRAPQTIAFTSTPSVPTRAATAYALGATAKSGLPVTFTSLTPAVCTATAAGQVSLLAVGTCTLAADQAGQGVAWYAAPQATQSFTVDVPAVAITLGGLARVYDGTPKAVTVATNPAGVAVTASYFVGSARPTTTAPTQPGSYPVNASPTNPGQWWGSAAGTLVIEMAKVQVTPSKLSLATTSTVTAYVYGSAIVDAAAIAPASVRLRAVGGSAAGAPVGVRNGLPMSTVRDFDGDGRVDRQLVFLMSDLRAAGLSTTNAALVLEDLTGGYRFSATPVVAPQVVP